jgi:hypothetical protein
MQLEFHVRTQVMSEYPALSTALDKVEDVLSIFRNKLFESDAFGNADGRHELLFLKQSFGDIAAELARLVAEAWASTARFHPISTRLRFLFQLAVATVTAANVRYEELRYVEF